MGETKSTNISGNKNLGHLLDSRPSKVDGPTYAPLVTAQYAGAGVTQSLGGSPTLSVTS